MAEGRDLEVRGDPHRRTPPSFEPGCGRRRLVPWAAPQSTCNRGLGPGSQEHPEFQEPGAEDKAAAAAAANARAAPASCVPPRPSTHRPAGTYSAGAGRLAGQRDPGVREECSAGAPGARGRGGGPWAEASLGVPAAAPRGHGLRAPGPGGTRAPLTAQRWWPPDRRGRNLSAALRADGSLAPARGRLALRAAEI